MMKKIFSLALLSFLLIGSGTAMAQNKKASGTKSNAKATQNKESGIKKDTGVKPGTEQELFYGTIRYDVVRSSQSNRRKTEPQTSRTINDAVSFDSKRLKVNESKQTDVPPEKMKVLFLYTKEGTYAYLERFGLASTMSLGTLLYVFLDPENPSVAKSNEKERLGLREDLQTYYVRTDETKEIAGCKAVRYDCHLPLMSGEIWVDESRTLFVENVPFYGMMHPVLECDLRIIVEDKEMSSYHLVASEIIPEILEEHKIERIMHGEFMEMPEAAERLRHVMSF